MDSLHRRFSPRDRLTTWVPGLMAVGGIPGRTAIFAALHAATYGNGTSDASSAIQAALDTCPVRQVVQREVGSDQRESRHSKPAFFGANP